MCIAKTYACSLKFPRDIKCLKVSYFQREKWDG